MGGAGRCGGGGCGEGWRWEGAWRGVCVWSGEATGKKQRDRMDELGVVTGSFAGCTPRSSFIVAPGQSAPRGPASLYCLPIPPPPHPPTPRTPTFTMLHHAPCLSLPPPPPPPNAAARTCLSTIPSTPHPPTHPRTVQRRARASLLTTCTCTRFYSDHVTSGGRH